VKRPSVTVLVAVSVGMSNVAEAPGTSRLAKGSCPGGIHERRAEVGSLHPRGQLVDLRRDAGTQEHADEPAQLAIVGRALERRTEWCAPANDARYEAELRWVQWLIARVHNPDVCGKRTANSVRIQP
jgi:hypothetical protein